MEHSEGQKLPPPNLGDPIPPEEKKPPKPLKFPPSSSEPSFNTLDKSFHSQIRKGRENITSDDLAVPEQPPNLDKRPAKHDRRITNIESSKKPPLTTQPSISRFKSDSIRKALRKLKSIEPKADEDEDYIPSGQGELRSRLNNIRDNEIISDDSTYLICSECKATQELPNHCFQPMKLNEDASKENLSCNNCDEIEPLPIHCEQVMDVQDQTDFNFGTLELIWKFVEDENYTKAKNHLHEIFGVDELKQNPEAFALATLLKGISEVKIGNRRDGKHSLNKAKEIIDEYKIESLDKWYRYYKGLYYLEIGDLLPATEFLTQARTEFGRLNDPNVIIDINTYLGQIKRLQGYLQEAEDLLSESVTFYKKQEDMFKLIKAKIEQSLLLRDLGEFNDAKEILFEVQTIATEINQEEYITRAGSILVSLGLELQDDQLVSEQLLSIERMAKIHTDTPEFQLRYDMANAIVNKNSTRMIYKARALMTYNNILESQKYSNFEDEAYILINICDLLLQEFAAFEEPEVFDELKDHIDRLIRKSQNHSHTIYINSLLLKTKLELIDDNFEIAGELLVDALDVAQENGLEREYEKILRMNKEMKKEKERWDKLHQESSSVRQKLDKSQIAIYVKQALELVKND